jgi:D-alanyl-D-alanine carboxypeptidase
VAYWSVGLVPLVAVIAIVALAAGEEERPRAAARAAAEPTTSSPAVAAPEPERALVLVRRRGGLPPSWITRLRRSGAVETLAEGSRAQWLLRRSTSGGQVVDAPPSGYAVPLDVFVVDPRAYARVSGEAAFRRLRGGRVLLSESSARVRGGLDRGDRMTLAGGRTVTVAGVVADGVARDAELVAAAADVPRAQRRQTAAIVATDDPAAVADAVPDDRLTRVGVLDPGSTATGGGVIRSVAVKERFGEFAVRLPYGEDWIGIDPAWQRRNIVTRTVPILGSVTCHRALIAPLRRALGRLQRQRLARLVDPGDYAGCFAPRRIPGSGSLSLHAWGLAVDINASANPQGSEPRQDPRVVSAFEREGFTWGGRWPTAPDGMHFELHEDVSRAG